jgi:hypothetical protein
LTTKASVANVNASAEPLAAAAVVKKQQEHYHHALFIALR